MAIDFGGDAAARFRRSPIELQRDARDVLEFISAGFSITWFAEGGPRIWHALLKPHPTRPPERGMYLNSRARQSGVEPTEQHVDLDNPIGEPDRGCCTP
jgi:hypothetical protein